MSYLKIGSGDTTALLSGLQTKGYANLWRKFLDEHPPYYNAFASPIDALRTGAILEDNYFSTLPDGFFPQVKKECAEMNVFTSSIDFAQIKSGKIVDFEELKTIYLTDFLSIIRPILDLSEKDQVSILKKKFKSNYNQVQFQLNCAELDSAKLVFLSVDSYDDEVNKARIIKENEYCKFTIPRDEEVISDINNRGQIFQKVKDHFK